MATKLSDLPVCAEIHLPLRTCRIPGGGRVGFMTYADTTADVTDPETGEALGSVAGTLGGHVTIFDRKRDESYIIRVQDIWEAVMAASAPGASVEVKR